MKILYSFLLVVLTGSITTAQNTFEGELHFSMTYSGENADQYAAFAPTGMTYKAKGADLTVEVEGGMAAAMIGKILVKGDEGVSYMIKDGEKTAYKMNNSEEEEEDPTVKVKTEATKETLKIQGYTCKKYIQTVTSPDGTVVSHIWTTTELKFHNFDNAQGANISIDGIEGFPLKKVTTMSMGGMNITTTELADKIEKKTLSDSDFKVPSGYEIKDFDAAVFGGK